MRMFRIVTSAAVLKSMTKISHYRLGHYAGLVATMLLTPVLWAEDCRSISGTVPDTADPFPATWGIDVANTRFVPMARTSINAENVHRLALKWVYGYATNTPRSFPLVTSDTIFIGDNGTGLIALDRKTGCIRWRNTDTRDSVASSISFASGPNGLELYFANRQEGIFAVAADTGRTLWQHTIDDEPVPFYSGSPMLVGERLFVPISSQEIALSMNPFYGCCTTSGGMAALDVRTGEKLWYLPTIAEPPQVIGRHYLFVEQWGPSGAPVWSAPTYDADNDLLLFGTGENYTEPATRTSDAIFAVDATSGKQRWVVQFHTNDTFNMGCVVDGPNCPENAGPDLDFGAPPVLAKTPSGRRLVFAGQKSGGVYAMDPLTGAEVWRTRIGRGGYLGGVHWGLAVDESRGLLYVPISDIPAGPLEPVSPAPGMHAVNLEDGTIRWSHHVDVSDLDGFWPGLSAGIIATQDLVVAGDLAGKVAAYSADDGRILWEFDTAQTFAGTNGVAATGASIDAHGPLIVDDLLIVSSGYGGVGMQGGNALLVFQLTPEPHGEPDVNQVVEQALHPKQINELESEQITGLSQE